MRINPERVELVRKRLGLNKNHLAEILGVDRKTLQRLREEGEASESLVGALVRISGYPEGFFFKSDPVLPNSLGVSFRSLRSLSARSREAALAAASHAFELDDWVRARIELPRGSIPQFSQDDPREAALALRASWGMGVKPIANMVNVLESHGIRVFSLVEETRHLDAYAFWLDDAPYVFLNTYKTAEHSRFDAAHELGHIVMHRHSGTTQRDAEHAANSFASEFLMPQADLLAYAGRVQTVPDLIKAKHRWGVSAAALNYALHKVGLIRDWQYKNNCIELNRAGRTNEPEGMRHETSQVWPKVLTIFWQTGITLDSIAEEVKLPASELTKLLFNISGPARLVERQEPRFRLVS